MRRSVRTIWRSRLTSSMCGSLPAHQVLHNRASGALQYAMRDRLATLSQLRDDLFRLVLSLRHSWHPPKAESLLEGGPLFRGRPVGMPMARSHLGIMFRSTLRDGVDAALSPTASQCAKLVMLSHKRNESVDRRPSETPLGSAARPSSRRWAWSAAAALWC